MGYLSSFLAIKHDNILYKVLIYIALLEFQISILCYNRPQGHWGYGQPPELP